MFFLIALSVVFRGSFFFGVVIACFIRILGRHVVLFVLCSFLNWPSGIGVGVAVLFDLGFVLIPLAEH